MTKQSMSQLVHELAQRGFVVLTPDPADGRAKLVHFTGKGAAVVACGQRIIAQLVANWSDELGTEGYERLSQLLESIPGPDAEFRKGPTEDPAAA